MTRDKLKVMKISVLSFSLVLLIISCDQKKPIDQRKENFPKTVEYVAEMPHPDSLWLFIMAGQSNMAGRGFVEPQDTIPNRRILTIDQSGRWIYAKEPLHFYEPKMAGLDCGMSFSRTLIDSLPSGITVGIIPCAVGGSAIEQWLNDETFRGVKLLSNFEEKVKLIKSSGTIKGIIWHQGESNAKPELIPLYAGRLDSLTKIFRKTVKNDSLPIIIAELGSYAEPLEKKNRWNSINTIIKTFAEKNPNTFVVNTQDLKQKGDTVHFDSESQRKMGERFAHKYLEIMQAEH